eukprot:8256476-Pyramimonas_sp.AAC.2
MSQHRMDFMGYSCAKNNEGAHNTPETCYPSQGFRTRRGSPFADASTQRIPLHLEQRPQAAS